MILEVEDFPGMGDFTLNSDDLINDVKNKISALTQDAGIILMKATDNRFDL
jgi:hypothetical protein